ncbi:hypothetical protein [Roseivivax sediminis]|uniref:Sulfotransferase family protein n=1 Tax=Roseivivax sediminis TaxID=936889 RepID=A0A1I2CV44_9RHOB|nr:hypothetical protein [Roseivivax sediminis]SFE72124.1 hypothetical protein SAMN04515678_11496 [Roseivivax sediminis]
MIISDSRHKVFCHIPKNGGSSLRAYFAGQWEDSRAYQGRREIAAGEAAPRTRDLTHITPAEAAAFFGDDLVGEGYTITAVIRPPIPRFSSALLQYIRTFAAQDKNFVTAKTVQRIMQGTSVEALCAAAREDHRHIHLRPQVDFVADVPEAQRDLILIGDLSRRFPDLPVDNPGGSLPGWMSFMRHPVIKRVAGRMGKAAKDGISRRLIRKDPQVKEAIETVTAANMAFLAEFYAEDQALHDTLAQKARTAA